jgi:serine/threonine protein kinase
MHSASSAPGSGQLVAGRYRLLGQLGRGAMGIVWHGHDELLNRHVAVKQIILAPAASDADARASYRRTLREARTAARLNHAGVVTVFDVVEEDGMPWIVMELIRARPLDQVIAEDGPLPPAQAAELGISLLDALSTAHAAGVLHRDVKPSNVLISPEGKAVSDRLRHRYRSGRRGYDPVRNGRRHTGFPRPNGSAAPTRHLRPTCGRSAPRCMRRSKAAGRSIERAARQR